MSDFNVTGRYDNNLDIGFDQPTSKLFNPMTHETSSDSFASRYLHTSFQSYVIPAISYLNSNI